MTTLHALHHPGGLGVWTWWMADPVSVLSLGTLAGIYAGGTRAAWRSAGRGRAVRRWQVWSFAAGVTVLVIALASPLDALSDQLFSAHMTQHVLLAVVAPPLIVAGAPVVAALWLMPPAARKRFVQWIKRLAWPTKVWAVITTPLLAFTLHAAAMWVWHVPQLYTLALNNGAVHAAEHLSFVGTASLMWWGFLYPRRSRRAAYAIGVVALFLTMLHSGALGALLTLSHRVWFPVHAAGQSTWNLAPLEDQQLAGLIMWVPGGLLYLAAMSALFLAWMRLAERGHAAPRVPTSSADAVNVFDETRSL